MYGTIDLGNILTDAVKSAGIWVVLAIGLAAPATTVGTVV